jgi:fructose-specific PTS system IIA-like component
MALELKFTCPLPNGVHARPATALEEVATCFGAQILLTNDRTGRTANAKSVLGIVSTDIRQDDSCRLHVSGPDEQHAMEALTRFLAKEFPLCDQPLPSALMPNGESPLPHGLVNLGARIYRGTPVVGGIGQGHIMQAGRPRTLVPSGKEKPDRSAEAGKLDAGLNALAANYETRLARFGSAIELELLRAHRSVARDPEFRARLHDELQPEGRTAATAILATEAHYCAMLTSSPSMLLRERALDLQDVCSQLLVQIYGKEVAAPELRLDRNSILSAECLTPGQFLRLDRRRLKGLVLAQASATSHTVILARSFGIPTLTALSDVHPASLVGIETILDGDAGLLLTGLTAAARRYYEKERARLEQRRTRERKLTARAIAARERCTLEIAANIGTVEEAGAALDAGAAGIGLFRTEMLFLERDGPPTEDEQFEVYRRVLALARNKPVIIRTLDIGGDKPLPWLKLPQEQNPFLGYRGARIYREFHEIVRTQIRALLRASTVGRLKIMLPMITGLEEVRWIKQVILEEKARLFDTRQTIAKSIPLGGMIEIPAASFLIDHLAHELDFFSIGTNDLLQCFAGADRTSPRVAAICDPLQPPFLRLLQKIVADARARRKWIGLCGEMAAHTIHLPLLAGLGLDEISAAASVLPALKSELARCSRKLSRQLLIRSLRCSSAEEVRHVLEDYSARHSVPLIEPDLILTRSGSSTKAEAIKEAVDRLYVLSRTDHPRLVEQAVWERETEHTTGFGHGFAIPHCKSSRLNANSLALIKLRKPVPWESLDGQPVKVVVLIAIRDGDQGVTHMKILSNLARKIMHEDFRQRLLREQDSDSLCQFLKQTLGLR